MRSFFRVGLLWAVSLLLGIGSLYSASAQTVFVAGSGNEFGTLNPATGAFTPIGTLTLPTGDNLFGLGLTATGLYGLDSQPNAHLFRINPSTGAVTDLGAVGQSAVGAVSNGNSLITLNQNLDARLYSVTPPSPSSNLIGNTGFLGDGMMAFDVSGNLFASAASLTLGNDDLYRINTNTGSASLVGTLGFSGVSAGVCFNNTIYGFTTLGQIITINTATGAGTLTGSYSLPNGDAIYATATPKAIVPEPSTLIFFSAGTLAMLGYAWRRRKNAA